MENGGFGKRILIVPGGNRMYEIAISRQKFCGLYGDLKSVADQFISAYASTGSQVQIRFLSPWVLLTLATDGQNLLCVT